jgi:hypothetical protein
MNSNNIEVYLIKGTVAAFIVVISACIITLAGSFIPSVTDNCIKMLGAFDPIAKFILGIFVFGKSFKHGAKTWEKIAPNNKKGKK